LFSAFGITHRSTSASPSPLNILILEEALQSGSGHWPVYIGDLVAAFRQAGDQVDVLVHRHADPALVNDLQATPWLSHNCWIETNRQGGLSGLRHALRYGREVRGWLKLAPHPDWVCALTMRLQHLLAFAIICRRPWHHGQQRYLLLFVQGFGVYQGEGLPVRFPPGPSTQLARWCFKQIAPAVRSGRVVLAAETRAMQAELINFCQLPVHLFPHPVSPAAPESPSSIQEHFEYSDQPNVITITCPGFARYEKGNDLLQDACRQLFTLLPRLQVQVISQWPHPFSMPDGTIAMADPALIADGRYHLINTALDRNSYSALLAKSDLIVLPYRRSSYHNRVSRVAIEAALHGVPLVYMSGTWIEEVVELTSAGVPIPSETAEAVATALHTGITQLPILQTQAYQAKAKVINFYSADQFRQLLRKQLQSPLKG
jgi:hypothetical protein